MDSNQILAALTDADAKFSATDAMEGFSLHPTGLHVAEIVECGLDVNTNKNQVQLALKCKTDAGSFRTWHPLTNAKDGQIAYSKRIVQLIGHNGTLVELSEAVERYTFIGKRVEVNITHETYDGKERVNVYYQRGLDSPNQTNGDSGFVSNFGTNLPDEDLPFS